MIKSKSKRLRVLYLPIRISIQETELNKSYNLCIKNNIYKSMLKKITQFLIKTKQTLLWDLILEIFILLKEWINLKNTLSQNSKNYLNKPKKLILNSEKILQIIQPNTEIHILIKQVKFSSLQLIDTSTLITDLMGEDFKHLIQNTENKHASLTN